MTKTKNERITTLENEVAELKLIVHELRERPQLTTVINNAPQGPSTINTVEDIIEFEGQQYRKVDREAREGDVIIIREPAKDNFYSKLNTPHKVVLDDCNKTCINNPEDALVYCNYFGRTIETVEVYELIESIPLTPNQQRAAIIEKAKKFVEEHSKGTDIVINDEYQVVTAIYYDGKDVYKESALCHPNDVYNEDIGKAIAVGRVKNMDISEFEQAVQPTIAVGQIVQSRMKTIYKVLTLEDIVGNVKYKDDYGNWQVAEGGYLPEETWYTIINDTNAKYEEGQ